MPQASLQKALPLVTVAAFLIFWEISVKQFDIKPFILPPPSEIAAALVEDFWVLLKNAGFTLRTLFLGYATGVSFGVLLAVMMTVMPLFRSAVYPLVVASQTIPKIAIAPLLILWFGVDVTPKVLIIALLSFFPVLINTVSGLESTDRGHLELMKSVNAGFWKIYRHVRVPAAIPNLFVGLKLALTVSVIGAIVGEWVAGNTGLGYLLLAYNASLQTNKLFAALFVIIGMSASCFLTIAWLEGKVSWRARLGRSGTVITGGV